MGFNIFQVEFLGEIAGDKFSVHAVFTGIDVNAHKLPVGKSMNAYVRFGHHHESAPASGVFYPVVVGLINNGSAKNIHSNFFGKLFKATKNQFSIIKLFEASTISVQREMLSEVACFFAFEKFLRH